MNVELFWNTLPHLSTELYIHYYRICVVSVARLRALRDFRELAKESKRRNREIAERVEQQMRQLETKQATEFTVRLLVFLVLHESAIS